MNKLTYFLLSVALCVATTASADWNKLLVNTTYPTWHEWGWGGDTINDEIYFTHRVNGVRETNAVGSGFGDQIIANPQVVKNDSGDWLIMGYGENTFRDTNSPNLDPTDDVADAIYVFKRVASNGQYVVPTTQAMRFAPGTTPLGYLGAGAGFAKTTVATSAGYKYFSIVPVSVPSSNLGWLAWAVSSDGETWSFVDSTGTGLTTDARQSFHVIRNDDPSNPFHPDFNGSYCIDTNQGNAIVQCPTTPRNQWPANIQSQDRVIGHTTMVYNPYDGYFYLPISYANPCGIKAWWWRIRFNSANPFGLTPNGAGRFNVEFLQTGSTMADDYYAVTDGVFNGGAVCSQSPRVTESGTGESLGPADPMNLLLITNSDGSFQTMLFVYAAEKSFNNPAYTQLTYAIRGTLPTSSTGNFVWQTQAPYYGPKQVDLTQVASQGYQQCSAGGGFYVGLVQNGNLSDGSPDLYGFVATYNPSSPNNDPTAGNCTGQWSGLLPVHFGTALEFPIF